MKKHPLFSNHILFYGAPVSSLLLLALGQGASLSPRTYSLPSIIESAEAESPSQATSNPHQMLRVSGANPHQSGSEMGTPHSADSFASGAARNEVSWTLPTGWTELAPTSMRLGNFLYTHTNGQKVEITVSALPGAAGGTAANFDMWRSQIGLPKVDESEVLKQSEKLKVGEQEMVLTDLVSTDNVIDSKLKARITGAIYQRGKDTWFFKMKGEDNAVKSLKQPFITFLNSLKFKDANAG